MHANSEKAERAPKRAGKKVSKAGKAPSTDEIVAVLREQIQALRNGFEVNGAIKEPEIVRDIECLYEAMARIERCEQIEALVLRRAA
jgi:hypothetical protein